MPEFKLTENSPITLTELRPRSFGRLDAPEPPDAYDISGYPPRALPPLHAVTEKAGFTNVRSITPAFNPRGRLNEKDWARFDESAVVGVSAISRTAEVSLELLRRTKERNPNVLTIMGGYHATFSPEYCLDRGADVVVIKEGDVTWPELLVKLSTTGSYEGVPGIAYRKNGKVIYESPRRLLTRAELSKSPLPVYSEQVLKGQNVCTIESSRGCPEMCTFCLDTVFNEGRYRRKSNEAIIEELKTFPRGMRRFWIADNFAQHIPKTKELLEQIIRLNLTPVGAIQARVEVVEDKELMKLFKQAGVSVVCIGFESDNDDSLKEMGKRSSFEKNEAAVADFREIGIPVFGMFIFGWDSDTPESISRMVDWAIKNELSGAQFFARGPLIGTPDTAKLSAEDRLLADKYSQTKYYNSGGPKFYLYDGYHVHFEPGHFTPYGLQKTVPDANRKFYAFSRARWDLEDIKHRIYAARTVSRVLRDPQTVAHFNFLESIEPPRPFQGISLS